MKFSLPTLLNGRVARLLIAALFAQGAAQAQNTFPASGNVGIGTTAPTYPLTVAGPGVAMGVDNTGLFAARNSAGAYEGFLWPRFTDNAMYMNYGTGGFYIRNNASAVTMFMTNAGNVGIGTAAPAYKLTLAGPGSNIGLDNNGVLLAKNTAGAYETCLIPRWTNNATFFDYGSGGLNIRTNGGASTSMHMSNAGNVGIGTTTPTHKLTVAGTGGVIGMDNASAIVVKNTAGTYEAFMWPRFSDNITYMNFGSGGLRIRNNGSANVIEANNDGRVGIGTAPTANANLTVKGSILAEQVRVRLQANWPDYVFTPGYRLAPLAEVAQYIRDNGHLPNVPSAAQVEKEGGVELGAMNAKLLEKVEELTLYLIEEKKAREKEVAELKAELNQLKGAGSRK